MMPPTRRHHINSQLPTPPSRPESRARFGKIVQAIFQNQRGAALVGINVNAYQALMWGIGAALAAVGGMLLALIVLVTPDMGVCALNCT